MFRLYYLSIFFLFIYSAWAQDQQTVINKMKQEVMYLASDNLKGRETGTNTEKMAADFIISKFLEYDLIEKGSEGYYQYFETSVREHPHSNNRKKINGVNVVGYIDNNTNETVVIGAHYDHLGYGKFGSLYSGEYTIHNGADDNASGVSILINLIPFLKQVTNYNFLFIAFSGEEHGLLGSSYYVKNPTINLETVRYMLNFDMVGRLNKDEKLVINGIGTSPQWKKLLNKSNTLEFDLKFTESGMGASDHTSFYLQDIPVIHFFTGQHEDYHKPSDDADKINYEGMYKIMKYTKSIIENSVSINNFDFQETASDSLSVPNFKVTLGIMPDYLFDGKGVRIDGVSKNKTAFKFGILKGDIIMKMGDIKITDMMSYMKALGEFEKGDTTNIVVHRQGELTWKYETIEVIFQ